MSNGVYLLEVEAWTGAAVETLRLATKTILTKPTDTPANTLYDGRIVDVGSLTRSLFANGGISGAPSSSTGFIEFANTDGGLDSWLGYGFDGRAFVLSYLNDAAAPVMSAAVIAKGTIRNIDTSDATQSIKFQIRDQLGALEVPLLTARYAGTTITTAATAEGTLDMKDVLKPWVFGSALNVPAKLVNAFDLFYQVSGGAVASITVYDGGVALANAGDLPALDSLRAAIIAPGDYATCLSLGIFRLGGSPVLGVTADVVEGATLASRSAARVAGRMLDLLGVPATQRNISTFDVAHAANPAEVGIFIDSDTTALELIGTVLNSVGVGILPSPTGLIELFVFAAPVAPAAASLNMRNLLQDQSFSLALTSGAEADGAGIPAWSVVVNWGRIWQTQAAGDLAGVVSDTRKSLLASATRQATAQNAATKTARLLASEITIDTLLVNQADASAVAAQRLALSGVRRDTLVFPVDIEEAVEIGQVVEVRMRRFGYDGGKLFLVIGRGDDYQNRIVSLYLWG